MGGLLLAALLGSTALAGCNGPPTRPRVDEAADAPRCDEDLARVSSAVRAASSAECSRALAACELDAKLREEARMPKHEPPKLLGLECTTYFSLADTCLPKVGPELRAALEPMVDAQKRATKSGSSTNQRNVVELLGPTCRAARLALESLPECKPTVPPCKCENLADPLCPCP